MSTSPAIERLLRPAADDSGIDRKALAGLLVEIAHSLKPELRTEQNGVLPGDLRLQQLRTLLFGHEIEVLSRLNGVMEDPERLAAAIGRVLPSAIAQATSDARLGHVLAPAMEKATESSIRSDPSTLVGILYPTIVPAIRKSIGETIDETFQSLNETLKYSLTWRGLRWRWEAWRTGTSFAEVVLKHTLVYQVEHVFLIHRHTGLLICHVAAENAASQDPQLVSSMLTAIQDFVRDSFTGAEQQGLDSLRLGELRLWSEPGPFATLVAVIRGDPPESLHDTLRKALLRIHTERHHALESFSGDSTGFGDVQAQLTECTALNQQAPPRVNLGRVIVWGWLIVMLLFAAAWGFRWWRDEQRWDSYIARLQTQPGLVITQLGKRDGKFLLTGLRDAFATDPQSILRDVGLDPTRVVTNWTPYQGLDPPIVLKRLQASLDPPPSVTLAVEGDRIVARGSAPSAWLTHARAAAEMLPAGTPGLDLSAVSNIDERDEQLWDRYVARLRAEPGIVITQSEQRAGKLRVAGLRDPLAVDPQLVMRELGIDPARVVTSWVPYQGLDPPIVLKRLQASLDPPPSVTLAVEGDRIMAQGSAPSAWLARARLTGQSLPAGTPGLDLSAVRNVDEQEERLWDAYIARLRAEPGLVVTETGQRDGKLLVAGLRDPLALDPQMALREASIDPDRVVSHWETYQSLDPEFVLRRIRAAFAPPATVTFAMDGDRIVATGAAPLTWIQAARTASRMLPVGAPLVDLSQVRDLHGGQLAKLREAIQSKEIRFDYRNSLPAAGQEPVLNQLAEDLKELAALAANLHVTTRVSLTGHADATGQGLYNLALSLARAESVRTLLKQRGVDPDLLAVRSAGTLEPLEAGDTEAARSRNRRVSFTVGIDELQ